MKFRSGLLVGFGAGYVLGAKAGRERYQQIVEATRAFLDNPGVQRLTDELGKTVSVGKDRVSAATNRKVEQVGSSLADQASKAKGMMAGETKASETKAGASKAGDDSTAAKASSQATKTATSKEAVKETGGEETAAKTPPSTPTRASRST